MLKSAVRTVFSAFTALVFAFGAVSQGAMPGCTTAASGHTGAAHEPGSSHSHSQGNPLPGGMRCVPHLCCAHLVTADLSTRPSALSDALAPSFTSYPTVATPAGRTPHLLPFATAPPRSL
jgi:hypothetical protein